MLIKVKNQENLGELISHLTECKDVRRINSIGKVKIPNPSALKFNMESTTFECRSPSCVAGHVSYLMKSPLSSEVECPHMENLMEFLGLSYGEADYIYLGRFCNKMLKDITLEETIKYLKTLQTKE